MLQTLQSLYLKDEEQTRQLGEDIALALRHGDLILIKGDLGSGKTSLARALIRNLANTSDLEVPSPTFPLVQIYNLSGVSANGIGQVAHFDLYRLIDEGELIELGFDETLGDGVTLVEWPERISTQLPGEYLIIELLTDRSEGRTARISGAVNIVGRIRRSLDIRRFLDTKWQQGCRRFHLTGDASARTYETVLGNHQQHILMNAPAMPDGPVIKSGKSYSELAHLAEDVSAFVAVDLQLSKLGFRVPGIICSCLDQGLLLIEDIGSEKIVDCNDNPVKERYIAAAQLLAELHIIPAEKNLPLPDGGSHIVPEFDRAAMQIELALFTDWYMPNSLARPLTDQEKNTFVGIWDRLIDKIQSSEMSLVMRDYHSPNIIWQDAGTNPRQQVGLIDFQDALIGPSSYDVASLAHDARMEISPALEGQIVSAYTAARHESDAAFNEQEFSISFAIMAAQRATKVLGIFVRLDQRDGKAGYLKKIPQIRDYLRRALQHPVLKELKSWYGDIADI